MADRGRPRSFDRNAALQRAMEVFWLRGYARASLAELTRAMGLTPPSLYAAFGSKLDLFIEALDLYAATEGATTWRRLTTAPSIREAIADLLSAAAEAFTRPETPSGCLLQLGARPGLDEAPAGEAARQRRIAQSGLILARIEQAAAEGELPEGFDAAAAAQFYAAVLQGMAMQARDGATREDLLAVARGAMAAWPGLVGEAFRARRRA